MAAKKVVNNLNKSLNKSVNSKNTAKTSLASDKKDTHDVPHGEKQLKDNRLTANITPKRTKDFSSITKANNIKIIDNNPANTKAKQKNKAEIKNIVSGKSDYVKNNKHQNDNSDKTTTKTTNLKNKQNSNADKTSLSEKAEKINALKRKMHKEIFQRCLERKLFTGADVWDEADPDPVDVI
ncbi:MAG: hypothetical protein WCX65_09065 [bacterium]